MKVKYIGKEKMDYIIENNYIALVPNKIYEVLSITEKSGMYRIVDESGEDYLYPTNFFKPIEKVDVSNGYVSEKMLKNKGTSIPTWE